MLVDSHAHVDDERFDADRDAVLERATVAGIELIINIGADMASSARSIALAEKYSQIYAAVGMHPHDAKDMQEQDYNQLLRWASHPKVVAIGEIGLDYHYDLSPRPVQKEVFLRQLDIARQTGKPFIIHEREAHADTFEIVRTAAKGLEGVFHCFSGSVETAREYLKLGFYISVAGPVTFPKSAKTKEVARYVPLDRLLVETDSPYLTPQAFRGRRNEPAHVRLVAEEIAALRNLSLAELALATTQNARRLFGIPAV
jgi:TatD DNase family protein